MGILVYTSASSWSVKKLYGAKTKALLRWNKFDMVVVILSFVGIALEEMKTISVPINPTIIRVMRVLRITRSELFLASASLILFACLTFAMNTQTHQKTLSALLHFQSIHVFK